MAEFQLAAQTRSIIGKKVKRLRDEGLVPGTLYGSTDEPLSLQFNYRQLETTLRDAGGTNLVDIEVEGDQSYPALAREVQRHVLKGDILHVDFFAVDMNTKIRAEIPIVYQGESPVVIARKGIMITGPNTLTVEMLPSRLMNEIIVDVSVLEELGDTISVSDLDLGAEIIVHNDPNEMIARIVQPSAARAEEAVEALEGEEGELLEGEEGEGEEEAGDSEE